MKRGLDRMLGASWHVVVGEDFTFDIGYEESTLYYALYASYAIVAWKVRVWGIERIRVVCVRAKKRVVLYVRALSAHLLRCCDDDERTTT